MSRYHSYINSAKEIIREYRGTEPFASFLKKYFAANKKYGSKDRKHVGHLCYCYFRLGKMGTELPMEERLLLGLFLCSAGSNEVLQALKPEWDEHAGLPSGKKLELTGLPLSLADVFPWKEELSDGIDHERLNSSFLEQPDVFLRLRPSHETWVKEKLSKAHIPFREIGKNCLAVSPASKIEQVLAVDYEVVIQDLNSQRTGDFLQPAIFHSSLPFISAWDCCAGSGGKSIMLYDLHNQLELTVSDSRESIIHNLGKRFRRAEIKNYRALVADISRSSQGVLANSRFDIIICDAPCTGSGTWGRTPEQLYYFDKGKIDDYTSRQKKIVANAIRHLGQRSSFIYITCSVFRKENEDVVKFIEENSSLKLLKMETLKGYDQKADTMFAAILTQS